MSTLASSLIAQLQELDLQLIEAPLQDPHSLLDRRASLLGQLSLLTRENPEAVIGHLSALLQLSANTHFLSAGVRCQRQNLVTEMQAAEQQLRHLQSLREPSQPLIDRLG